MKQDVVPYRVGWTFVGDIDETNVVVPKPPKVKIFEDSQKFTLSSILEGNEEYLGEIQEAIDGNQCKASVFPEKENQNNDADSLYTSPEPADSNKHLLNNARQTTTESETMASKVLTSKRPKRLQAMAGVDGFTTTGASQDTNSSNSRWKFPRNSIHLVRFRHSFGWSIRSRIRSKNKREEVWVEAPTATYSPSNESISNQSSKDYNEGCISVVEQDELLASTRRETPTYHLQKEMSPVQGRVMQPCWW